MIKWLVKLMFNSERFREAMFMEGYYYESIKEALDEPVSNLSWQDSDGLWYGWYINEKKNKYLFNDIGHESMYELWQSNWDWSTEVDNKSN